MDSSVKSRPNHYEVLGLTPGASEDEINRAFARQMGMPRSAADVAHIGVAYEILRNPGRRRAYDESLGLGAKPKPAPQPAVTFRSSAQFSRAAPASRIYGARGERRVAAPAPEPAAVAPLPEPKPAPFVAAPKPEERPRVQVERALPSSIDELLAAERDSSDDATEVASSGWNRTAVAVGGLFVAAVLVGAWAGLEAGNAEEPAPAERSATTALAKPKPVVRQVAPEPAAEPIAVAEAPRPAAPVRIASRQVRRSVVPAPPTQPLPAEGDQPLALQSGGEDSATVATAAEAATDAAPTRIAEASAPLPNAVMARTIGRIGYACGQVASTSAVEGESGVFKVTCTSGHSYRAAPVRGRYHFRRWDR